jgi:hypothetical protein
MTKARGAAFVEDVDIEGVLDGRESTVQRAGRVTIASNAARARTAKAATTAPTTRRPV